MKRLYFSRKSILRAIRLACLTLFFAACAQQTQAAPTFNGSDFQVSGSTVTDRGINNTTSAYFSDTGSGTYNVSVGGVSLGNTTIVTGGGNTDLLYFSTGSVTNAGTLTAAANGIFIVGNGTVTNSASGSITATHEDGISIGSTGTVTNSGSISSSNASGVFLGSGTVNNAASGTISGYYGVNIYNAGTVTNSGSITGTGGFGSKAIWLEAGGTITNATSATISGYYGVSIAGNGTISNSGTISGSGYAIRITGNGTVTNAATGIITSTNGNGLEIDSAGTVNNSGSISGSDYAIRITGTGIVTNSNSGSITSSSGTGAQFDGMGTVNNYGTISGHERGLSFNGVSSVFNFNTISGTTGAAIFINNDGTVINSGLITGGSQGLFINGNGTVTNTGSVTGAGSSGIYVADTGNVTLAGGSVSGTSDAVEVNASSGTPSTITILGRTSLTGGLVEDNGTGTLNLNLVGLTPAEAAALKLLSGNTSGTFTVGTHVYDWANLALIDNSISLEQVVDPGLKDIASKIDNTNQGLPGAYDPFLVAASFNPEGALNTLTGREINNAIDAIGVNQTTVFSQEVSSHLDNLNNSGVTGGFDTSNLHLSTASLLAFDNASAQLDSLMHLATNSTFGRTSLSTDTKIITPPPPSEESWGAWASGTVTLADQSSSNVPGYRATTGSPTLGVDFKVTPQLRVGVLANYTTTGADFSDGSHLGAQTGLGGFYGTWKQDNWHVNGLAAGGYTSYDINRSVFGSTASSHPGGWEAFTDWTAGYDFNLNHYFRFTPELGLTYAHLGVNSHNEGGAGAFDLAVAQQDIDSLRSHLGGRLTASFQKGDVAFFPELHAGWYHEFLDDSRGVNSSLPGAPALGSFLVQTTEPQRDFALVGMGLNTTFTGAGLPMAVFIDYNAQVGQSDYIAHTIDGGMRVGF